MLSEKRAGRGGGTRYIQTHPPNQKGATEAFQKAKRKQNDAFCGARQPVQFPFLARDGPFLLPLLRDVEICLFFLLLQCIALCNVPRRGGTIAPTVAPTRASECSSVWLADRFDVDNLTAYGSSVMGGIYERLFYEPLSHTVGVFKALNDADFAVLSKHREVVVSGYCTQITVP
ncbi:hypothetical protein HOY80DRAFT_983128 [Tuber brumale]|nr:hypothetical protein HOY80DRAFT_983128 [Tuber brumale]